MVEKEAECLRNEKLKANRASVTEEQEERKAEDKTRKR